MFSMLSMVVDSPQTGSKAFLAALDHRDHSNRRLSPCVGSLPPKGYPFDVHSWGEILGRRFNGWQHFTGNPSRPDVDAAPFQDYTLATPSTAGQDPTPWY